MILLKDLHFNICIVAFLESNLRWKILNYLNIFCHEDLGRAHNTKGQNFGEEEKITTRLRKGGTT